MYYYTTVFQISEVGTTKLRIKVHSKNNNSLEQNLEYFKFALQIRDAITLELARMDIEEKGSSTIFSFKMENAKEIAGKLRKFGLLSDFKDDFFRLASEVEEKYHFVRSDERRVARFDTQPTNPQPLQFFSQRSANNSSSQSYTFVEFNHDDLEHLTHDVPEYTTVESDEENPPDDESDVTAIRSNYSGLNYNG